MERITTGLITGAAVINITADVSGIPFFTKLRNTGMETQSHTGRQNPPISENKIPSGIFFGKCRSINCLETNSCIKEESKTPVIKNGKACKMIPKKANIIICTPTLAAAQFATRLQI